jgi:hypothetical protein
MYILLKKPAFLTDVLSIMRDADCVPVQIYAPRISRAAAEVVYSNFTSSPHYEDAVRSLMEPEHVFVLEFELPAELSISDFKSNVQGPFGTSDEATIRGYIASALGTHEGGIVHVPDTREKALEDMSVFGEPFVIS